MNFIKQHVNSVFQFSLLCSHKSLRQPYILSTVSTSNFVKGCVYSMSSDVFSHNNWRGVPLTELYGSQSPWGAPEFPLVTPGYNHAVLYHVPASGLAGDRPPKPQIGVDKWDQEHLKLPCSSHSLYPVEDSNGETHLEKRWAMIERALQRPIHNTKELADAILSYNTKFRKLWKFRSLHKLFNEYLEEEESQYFFDVTLPEIAKLALALPKLIQAPIPLLRQHKNSSVSLSQQQITSLLANAFFCTFPRRNTTKRTSEYGTYPYINFNKLYESSGTDHIMEKLKCICHYFRRVCTKAGVGVLTFSRRSVPPRGCPSWGDSDVPLASLPLHVDPDNTIEDADGLIQVDFANRFLGGGVLNHGCVQEEIRFVICPELLVSMLFTEVLRPNEALLIIGAERYSKYSGYGHTFHWTGDFLDTTPFDSTQRRRCAVLAIDALPYNDVTIEYRPGMILRELNKAWIGFSFATDPATPSLNYPGVATGNWGCGAFGGTPQLKSLVQMMACSHARRPMAYYTFKDLEIRDDVIGIYNLLARYNVTVGQLYKYIMRFAQTDVRYTQLHAFLHQTLLDEDKSKLSQDKNKSSQENGTQNKNKSSQDNGTQDKSIPPQSNSIPPQDKSIPPQDKSIPLQDNSIPPQDKSVPPSEEQKCTDELSKEPEKMDISMTSETSLHDLSLSSGLQRDFAKDSPDLFAESQDDKDHSLVEVKVQNDIPKPTASKRKSEKMDTPKPSGLFEEMQKLDEQSGRLNLSVSNTSTIKHNVFHDANTSVGNLETSMSDPTTEMKKRVSRKITDYFTKKSI